MKKTLVIFDIDGTLLHSNGTDSRCFAQTYEAQFGRPFPSIDWSTYPHVTDHVIFNTVIQHHFGRPAHAEDIERQQHHFVQLLEARRQTHPAEFKEVRGAVAAVQHLLAQDAYAVGIATGGWQAPAQVKLRHLGFPIERFYASYADNKHNREAILSEALAKAQAQHRNIDRVVYVGDALWDVRTTRNLEMPFIGIRHRNDVAVLEAAGAATVLQDYRDLALFERLIEAAVPPR